MSETKQDYKIEGRPATIFRTVKNKENPYVMIDRRPIDNPALSFKAKGILTYLMSRPDGWEVNITDLMNHGKEGAAAIRTGLRELRDAHHVNYIPARMLGRITGWIIEVYEIPYDDVIPAMQSDDLTPEKEILPPDDDFLHVENLQVENLHVENRTQVLSTLSNKQSSNKEKYTHIKPDFSHLSVTEAKSIKELQDFKDATGWFPGSFIWEVVYDAMQSGINPVKLREAFTEWNARGYNPRNVAGYLDWAVNGIPEQKKPQKRVEKRNDFATNIETLQAWASAD